MSTLFPRPIVFVSVVAGTCTIGAMVVVLWFFDPSASTSPFPPCVFHELTGYFCIGCGITRALHALVHGDLLRAFGMNPLAMIVLPLVPLMIAYSRGWQPRWLRPLMKWAMEPKLWLVLLPSYWIARNLPWFPFTLLAPG